MKQLKKILAVAALPVMLSLYSAPSQAGIDLCQWFPILCGPPVRDPVSVPEPATLALMGLGLAAAGLARRKNKK